MARSFSAVVTSARAVTSRATATPFLVRCGVGLSGLLAMLVAWPVSLLGTQYFIPLTLLAIYPAVAPRGRGATLAAMAVVGGWLVDTAGYGAEVELWRVLSIATLLYLGHSLTALAAVLPFDAVVNLDMVGGWMFRAALVVLISAVLTVFTLALSADLAGSAFLVATLVGIAGAVGATVLIARLLQRA
ncbi:hypothetical protein BJ973_006325 [Actinoplanes tereljensis]|uniref:Uncharacterized protein n=1 Tax=Paractinoplanes tereljensis TaxID=571912 RepID=A0A919TSD7_9ACTN|nr:hypothetical protein [Actinoplanes tereljensis]GIF19280.1 hypothetical protein Ate02nite_20100 [Actinoplanes tereljensis]